MELVYRSGLSLTQTDRGLSFSQSSTSMSLRLSLLFFRPPVETFMGPQGPPTPGLELDQLKVLQEYENNS